VFVTKLGDALLTLCVPLGIIGIDDDDDDVTKLKCVFCVLGSEYLLITMLNFMLQRVKHTMIFCTSQLTITGVTASLQMH
jgi:hypothetical protein